MARDYKPFIVEREEYAGYSRDRLIFYINCNDKRIPWLMVDLPVAGGICDEWYFQFTEGRPLRRGWSRVSLMAENRQAAKVKGFQAFTMSRFGILGFSERTRDTLKDLLEPYGEFLPVLYGATVVYLYNCTTVYHAVDEERSDIFRLSSGLVADIKRAVVVRDRLGPAPIFRDALCPKKLIFRSSDFDAAVAAGIQGYVFIPFGVIVDA